MLLPCNQHKTLNSPIYMTLIDKNSTTKVDSQYSLEPTVDNTEGHLPFRLVETKKRTLEKRNKQQSVFPVDQLVQQLKPEI